MKIIVFILISIGVSMLVAPYTGSYAFGAGLFCFIFLMALFGK
jgi:hypothetical protein